MTAILFNMYTKTFEEQINLLGFSINAIFIHFLLLKYLLLCIATSTMEYSRRFTMYGAGRRSSDSNQSWRILQDSKAASLATYFGIRDRRGGSLVSNSL